MKLIHAMAAAAALSGCAGVDLHVPAVQILFTTPDTIKLHWHTPRFTEERAQALAVAYCGGRPVSVVDASPPTEYRNKTWRCS